MIGVASSQVAIFHEIFIFNLFFFFVIFSTLFTSTNNFGSSLL